MSALSILPMAAYALSAAAYLVYLLRPRDRIALAGELLLAAGVVLQVVDMMVHRSFTVASTPEALSVIACLTAAGFLLASLRHRLAAAGAFAAPSTLVLLVLARIAPAAQPRSGVPLLGITHVVLATLATSVFALAATLAVLYLIEERQLKRREFGRIIGFGSPLETLDRLALRCVSFGFPVFTLAIVTGAVWFARLGLVSQRGQLQIQYVFSVASWIAFGVLLVARLGAGWRGRRAAWLALGGFLGTIVVLVAYVLRRVG